MKPLFPGSSETGAMNLRALLDPASARPGQPKHTLHMALELHATGPAVESARPDLFVSFVLDTSGSMAGKPLEQVARSVHLLLELLGEQDHVGLVSFADQAVPAVAKSLGLASSLNEASLAARGIAPGEIVRVDARDLSRDELLDAIVAPLDLEWRIENETLRVFAAPAARDAPKP